MHQPACLSAPLAPPTLPPTLPYTGIHPLPGASPPGGPYTGEHLLPGLSASGPGHPMMAPAPAAPPPPQHSPGAYSRSSGLNCGGSPVSLPPPQQAASAPHAGEGEYLVGHWAQVVGLSETLDGKWAAIEAFDPLNVLFTVRVLMS